MIAASVVAVVKRLEPTSHRHDPAALNALHNLAEAHLRTDLLAEDYRLNAKRHADAERQAELAGERARAEVEALRAAQVRLEAEVEALRAAQVRLEAEVEALRASTSWRITAPLRTLASYLRA